MENKMENKKLTADMLADEVERLRFETDTFALDVKDIWEDTKGPCYTADEMLGENLSIAGYLSGYDFLKRQNADDKLKMSYLSTEFVGVWAKIQRNHIDIICDNQMADEKRCSTVRKQLDALIGSLYLLSNGIRPKLTSLSATQVAKEK